MATRDPETKRQRLLDAALAEFSAYGIAGARVDRIAKLAGVSAGLVYTHFGSKDELFDAVFDAAVVRTVTEVPITPEDLPGYAGRLFDGGEEHPEVARLATWHRLEREGTGRTIPAVDAANRAKAEAVRAAQEAGTVSRRFEATHLLAVVLALATMWSARSLETQPPESQPPDARRAGSPPVAEVVAADRARRRATVVDAVRLLVEP